MSPELVAVERDTNLPRVFRVLWSLSHAAGGRLRLAQVGKTGGTMTEIRRSEYMNMVDAIAQKAEQDGA